MGSKRSTRRYLEAGEVLKTSGFDGYWGCAVVLTNRGRTADFDPMCHIGITSVVYQHDYSFDELDPSALSILEFDRQIRVGPNRYAPLPLETCIGIYASRMNDYTEVIGHVDPRRVFSRPLRFDFEEGSSDWWPLCGPVSESLGNEAVITWRRAHDREAWEREFEVHHQSTEDLELRLAEKGRQQRRNRKGRPSTSSETDDPSGRR